MAVEQRARARTVAALPHHDRVPGGRANAAVEPDTRQILRNMLCCGATLRFVCRIGGNRRDPQQREQPIETLLEVLIDAVENGVEDAHGLLRHPVA